MLLFCLRQGSWKNQPARKQMTTYLLANWKSNKTLSEARRWLETFLQHYRPHPHLQVIVAPPAIYLEPLRGILDKQAAIHISLAAQDLSPFPTGSYTGAVAADMVRGLVDFAILGHSERRRHFHESHQHIANKVSETVDAGITPLLCVDLPYAQQQFSALNEQDIDKLLIGYGPVEAIGLDIPQAPEKTLQAIEKLQTLVPDKSILYGGSVSTDNAASYLSIPGVAGLMVASACMDPIIFNDICKIAGQGM